jgi:hypothetical protein
VGWTQVGHGENGGKYGMDIRCLVIQVCEIKKNIKNMFVKSKVEMNRDDTINQ